MTALISGSTGSGNVTDGASKIYETKTTGLNSKCSQTSVDSTNICLRFSKSEQEPP